MVDSICEGQRRSNNQQDKNFEQLFNQGDTNNEVPVSFQTAEMRDEYPSRMEIENATKKLKTNKSPDQDTITAKLLKHVGNTEAS